eukprot:120160_1
MGPTPSKSKKKNGMEGHREETYNRYEWKELFNDSKWSNSMGYKKFCRGKGYLKCVNGSSSGKGKFYHCGYNLTNLLLKCFGYNIQKKESSYPYRYFGYERWGLSGHEFCTKWLDHCFNYTDKKVAFNSKTIPWNFIDNTDFKNYAIIALTGSGTSCHYIAIIGVSKSRQEYLCTDQSRWIYRMNCNKLAGIMRVYISGQNRVCVYRVG